MKRKVIEGRNLFKEFSGQRVVDNFNFCVRSEDFLTILGPSGSGKTTVLRMIGGFEMPTAGDILFEDKVITSVPPYERPINTVFQKYALFPHMDVYENIAFGLRLKKMEEQEIRKRVGRMLELVTLRGFEKRAVDSLSGGEQQRVATARALVNGPKVLLLDEPLGARDLEMRKEMQVELKYMQQELGITFIYVTHDQEEALTMSNQVIVMNKGRIEQFGTPVNIYNEPVNAFVADFIGESNILDGIMYRDYEVGFAGQRFRCVDAGFGVDQPVEVVIRPEDIKLVSPEEGMLRGIVDSIVFKGVHYEMVVLEGQRSWLIQSTIKALEDTEVGMRFNPDDIHIMKKQERPADA